jgi:hypothetical protein
VQVFRQLSADPNRPTTERTMDGSLAWVPLLFIAITSCSSASSGSGGPAVDASKELSSLSVAELQTLCDWSVQQQGGYGAHGYCEASGTPLETPSDQATCVAEVTPHYSRPTCTTTVGQWAMCIRWFVANWCSATPLAHPPAECVAFQTQCYGSLGDAGGD